ncbi:MAG TPA: hypothetical protein VFL57_19435, partial [Bryobacteraceae bacterium]|nr:hypothetical protein [Bryobacteraceae bacterium]
LVLTSPVIARDGTFAYNDTALAALIFGMFLVLEIWRAERQTELLICGGLLAGLAFAVKYTGALAIAWAITTVLLASRRARPALIVAGAAALVASPWLIRNAVYTGNPVAPFFNRWFPNPYFYADWERNYLEHLRNFGGLTGREVVTEPLVRGERAQGLAGPLFLLAPIGLWALRHAAGRWLAAAGVVFALPFTQNMGTRFLIPALPFWALCTGVALANARGALALLTVLQAVASWPAFTGYYCGEAAWRLEPQLPFDATLRNIPEDRYLAETEPQYIAARMLEELVPAGGRVFAFSPVAEAYTTRRVVVGYQSAFAVRIREMLWAATIPELHQLRVQEFRFPARVLDRMRLIQTATHPRETWSVSELRVFSRDRELPRDTRWRLRANPNPWEVQRAFDNSELTRWVSHTPLRPGCFVEVSFGRPESIDRVVVESTRDQYQAKLALETAGEGGPWVGIGREAIEIPRSAMVRSVRRAAVEEVKREGITHLLIETSDFKAEDFHMRTANWGIELVGERGNARLYKLK